MALTPRSAALPWCRGVPGPAGPVGDYAATSRPALLSAPSTRARLPGKHVTLSKVKVSPVATPAAGVGGGGVPPTPVPSGCQRCARG